MKTTDHWIGGKAHKPESGQYFDVLNPLDDSVMARAAHGNSADTDAAVNAAHAAFADYRLVLAKDRERMLIEAAAILEREADDFVQILIDEVGSPIKKAKFEVALSLDMLRAAAGSTRQVTGKTYPSEVPGRISMSVREPLGVVVSITPFNVPLIKGIRLSANPLAAGNTVVLLPSEEAPILANRIGKLYKDAGFPDGAFNVVSGFGYEIGDSLTTHPLVKVVTFTGSTRVGSHIGALCGQHKKPMVLELGGKSPLVIMADADMDKAVAGAVHGIFTYQGQVCMGSSRIYVERPVYDDFLKRFITAAEGLSLGDLRDEGTILGPIISGRQRDRVRRHIEDAVDKGAVLQSGGVWEGNRCRPTILTGVEPSMSVCKEETFGPVASVYPIDSFEEAVEKSNDSEYGLSAAIYTNNLDHAMQYTQQVKSGMVHVNAPTLHDEPHVPFGGVGESGFGRERTEEDIHTMTEWKWVTIQL